MEKLIKKWNLLLLMVCVMVMGLSITAFATEQQPAVIDTVIDEGEGNPVVPVIKYQLEDDNVIIELDDADQEFEYNGKEHAPMIKVFIITQVVNEEDGTVVENTEEVPQECYEVTYSDNVNVGSPTITVTGNEKQGCSGTISTKEVFSISPKSLSGSAVDLSTEKYTYDGKDKKPSATVTLDGVTLARNEDYKLTYSNNKEVGTATAVIEGVGNYKDSKKVTYTIKLGKPTVTVTPNYNKIKISWTKVTGASGYDVLRSTTKNKGYKTIKTITSGSTISYTDEKVSFNKKYYYVIHAYRKVNGKKVYADFSAQKSQTVQVATPKISKISRSSATALKVSWNKISGASGYALYRSTSEKGKYSKIAAIKSGKTVSYTDKGRSCGKTYYYKVKAYRTVSKKNYYGSYSPVKSGNTTPGKVSWNKTTTSYNSTSVTLKWKKVPEATGYSIYRSTEKYSGYKKVKVITKNSTLSWKDTGLEKGVVYYYKIRSYKNMGKYPVYGSYSSTFTKSVAGWKYVDGYKLYYNNNGKVVKDVSNLIGKQSSYVIKINKKKNTVTVYAKDGKKGYIIPVKAFVCSTGAATPLGTFKTPQKIRWHELDGPSYGQWCTRITGHILFHSVWYYKPKNTTLSVAQYNKLGTQASHGCVRLTAGDAKWIYDNCKLKTKVIIYNSNNPGPLGKPTAHKLPSWHTWDPTDPNVKSKCAKKGCH